VAVEPEPRSWKIEIVARLEILCVPVCVCVRDMEKGHRVAMLDVFVVVVAATLSVVLDPGYCH